MAAPSDYTACIQRLLTDIGYHYEPLPPYDEQFWGPFHTWTIHTLGPTLTYTPKQLTDLKQCAGTYMERTYPHTQIPLKLVFAKLTAIGIVIDDAIEDNAMNDEIARFSHRLYIGEAQPAGTLLALFHESLKELSGMFGDDAVLRDAAMMPWITLIDGCLMEKQIFTTLREQEEKGSSEATYLDSVAEKFPEYLRLKSGVAEAYAAAAFTSNTTKPFPLQKYVRAFPDLNFYINVMNDILSFHKEELAGEKWNLIHLRTRSLYSKGERGTGPDGEWTPFNTLTVLCDELRAAMRRIDEILRLDDCEHKMDGKAEIDVDEEEIEIAKRWRGCRDGYVSWHFESPRYKLGFMRSWAQERYLPRQGSSSQ